MVDHPSTPATGALTRPDHEASVVVGAPPAKVWSMVAEVTRMGEWSPVCHRCEWVGEPAAPEVGARFRGHNRMNGVRWSRECVVTESYQVVSIPTWLRVLRAVPSVKAKSERDARANIGHTLEPLAEAAGGAPAAEAGR